MANKYAKTAAVAKTGERKLKDNSRKHPGERDKWNVRKREGRPKQQWVPNPLLAIGENGSRGHWERVA
jgi:hypothetical protein